MVTTAEGMLNGIHGDTTDLWPAVTLDLVLVISTASLQQWLVNTTTAGDDANGTAAARVKDLLAAGWQLDAGLAGVGIVRDDDARVARGLGNLATIANLHLNTATGGTFGHLANGQNIANVKGGLVAAVDGLAGGGALGGDEGLGVLAVLVAVLEVHLHQGCATTGIVDDVLDDTLDEAMSLGEINRSVLGSTLACSGDGLEDATGALTTGTDDTSHL